MLSAARSAAAPTGVELTMRRPSRQPVVHHRLRVAIRQRSESPTLRARSIASPVELSRAIAGAIGNEGQWSITVARIEIPSNDPAALVIGGVGDVGPPILQRGYPLHDVGCRAARSIAAASRLWANPGVGVRN